MKKGKNKNGEAKKPDLPQIQEKYQNLNKLDEYESRFNEEKNIIEQLKKENLNLFSEIKKKELELVILVYSLIYRVFDI